MRCSLGLTHALGILGRLCTLPCPLLQSLGNRLRQGPRVTSSQLELQRSRSITATCGMCAGCQVFYQYAGPVTCQGDLSTPSQP